MGDILGIPIILILRVAAVVVLLLLVRAAWKAVRQHGVAVFFSVVLAFIFFFVLFAILLAGLDQLPQGGDRLLDGFENVIGWVSEGNVPVSGVGTVPVAQPTGVPPQAAPAQPVWPPAPSVHFEFGGQGITIPKGWALLEEPFAGADEAPGVFPLQVLGVTVECSENWNEAIVDIRQLFAKGYDVTVWYEPNTPDCVDYLVYPLPETPRSEPQLAPSGGGVTGGGTTSHTVQPGETLLRIAQRYDVSQAAILAANPQISNPNRIYPGQVLQIPSP